MEEIEANNEIDKETYNIQNDWKFLSIVQFGKKIFLI